MTSACLCCRRRGLCCIGLPPLSDWDRIHSAHPVMFPRHVRVPVPAQRLPVAAIKIVPSWSRNRRRSVCITWSNCVPNDVLFLVNVAGVLTGWRSDGDLQSNRRSSDLNQVIRIQNNRSNTCKERPRSAGLSFYAFPYRRSPYTVPVQLCRSQRIHAEAEVLLSPVVGVVGSIKAHFFFHFSPIFTFVDKLQRLNSKNKTTTNYITHSRGSARV